MKKLLKIGVCCALIAALPMTTVFGRAVRRPRTQVAERVITTDKTIFSQDFNSDTGTMPAGVTTSNSGGTSEISEWDVGGGLKKNCLALVDTTPEDASTGPNATINVSTASGNKTAFTLRFMKTAGSTPFQQGYIDFWGEKKQVLRVMMDAGGNAYVQGNNGNDNIATGVGAIDKWYTLTVLFDFDAQRASVSLLDESTNTKTVLTDLNWRDPYPITEVHSINQIIFYAGRMDGTWVLDYVMQEDNPDDLDEVETETVGMEVATVTPPAQHAVAGQVNVNYNENYFYPATEPYLAEDGTVMMTMRNIAGMMGGSYQAVDGAYQITVGGQTLEAALDSTTAELDGESVSLPQAVTGEGNRIFIPLQAVVEAFGCTYTWDEEQQCAFVVNPNASEEEAAGDGEEGEEEAAEDDAEQEEE